MSRSSSLPFVFADGEGCLHDSLDSAKANVASTLATMEMRESNAARGHKLSRLSISEEAQQDLDLEAKTAEANCQQALAVRENAEINFERPVVHSPVNG
jgi:multidrug resistance efflux pump